jgi:hypothetical protein
MAVGTVSGIEPDDNWQLVASQAMSGLNTYTFSSLSGYKTYWVVGKGLTNGTADIVAVRINGDSSAGSYASFWAVSGNNGYFLTTQSATTAKAFTLEIKNANKSIPHQVKSTMYSTANPVTNGDAYVDPAPITSITVSAYSSNNFSGGTVYLYGIAA